MEGTCDIWEAVTLGVCNSKQDGTTALTNNANYVNLHCFDCVLGAFLVLFLGVACSCPCKIIDETHRKMPSQKTSLDSVIFGNWFHNTIIVKYRLQFFL